MQTFCNVINNELTTTTQTRHSTNPATGQPNSPVPLSTPQDLDHAVDAAQQAFRKWSKTTIEQRRAALNAYADAMEANQDALVQLLTTEQGKPLSQSAVEVGAAIATARMMPQIPIPENVIEDTEERRVVQRYTPIGVACAIVPWNFPVLLAMMKIVSAVTTGNAVIVKPSPFTPYSALKLAELATKCFPPGVIQALSGDDALGPWTTEHPGIGKISFTGSSLTGKRVMASCAKTLKRVTLELGGNDACIVCDDVDLDVVVQQKREREVINTRRFDGRIIHVDEAGVKSSSRDDGGYHGRGGYNSRGGDYYDGKAATTAYGQGYGGANGYGY